MKGTRVRLLAVLLAFGLVQGQAFAGEPPLPDAEFGRLFKRLHVKNQPWAGIPWQTSLTEARKRAARENKPIFFNVNIGNALGAFLGGTVIAWGWGYVAPALVGAVLAVLGLGVAVISGLVERRKPLA